MDDKVSSVECGLAVVHPWLCDSMGHLTTRHYLAMFDDAAYQLFMLIGYDPSLAAEEHWGWADVRHEIDYLRPVLAGQSVTARTWVGEAPKGARFDRHMEFVGDDGKLRVKAKTQWAIIEKAVGRPVRVPAKVIAPFLGVDEGGSGGAGSGA